MTARNVETIENPVATGEAPETSAPAKSPVILIVEDSVAVRRPLAAWLALRFAEHAVVDAGDGEAAIEAALQHCPQLVVMDLRLPGMSGIEATRRIKASLPKTEVVMLTAYDDEAYRRAASDAGAHGYVLKSLVYRDLVPAITTALRKAVGGAASPATGGAP
jgi:DNA-binding NarL/FixJ family response regulator